jgi:hypothetical protein
MIFPQSIRQGDTGRCDQNGLGRAEKWISVSPWSGALELGEVINALEVGLADIACHVIKTHCTLNPRFLR